MSTVSAAALRRTPLYGAHRRLGGRMVEFGGWEMPVQYQGILEEHRAVRSHAGLFDVSHMGEVEVTGSEALAVCQRLLTNDVSKLRPGDAQYSVMCLPDGGTVDDVVYYRLRPDRFFFCVNASNQQKDFEWIRENRGGARVVDRSGEFAQLALQGPCAEEILAPLAGVDIRALRSFSAVEGSVAGAPALVSRTGYTGEDGFEIYLDSTKAEKVWNELLEAGRPHGLVPVGLGARDTLRLEAALMLYGNELDATTTPLEAGLGRLVKWDKGDFIGREALWQQKEKGLRRKLAGLEMADGSVPRHGYSILARGVEVGSVTSGTKSPTLGPGIALGYLVATRETEGAELEVEIRGRRHPARVVRLPFYRRVSNRVQRAGGSP